MNIHNSKNKTIFISHSSKDCALAEALCQALEEYGYPVLLLPRNSEPGHDVLDLIQNGLKKSDLVVALVSSESLKSPFVKIEVNYAISKEILLPVLLESYDKLRDEFVALGAIHCIHFKNKTAANCAEILNAVDHFFGVYPPSSNGKSPHHTLQILLQRKPSIYDRTSLLKYIYDVWLDGVLKKAILGDPFQSDFKLRPEVLWRSDIYQNHINTAEMENIYSYFLEADGKLFVLGDPGSGKTTQLLLLAKKLWERASANNAEPIPLLFSLYSWAAKHSDLASWLVDELHRNYPLSKTQARRLINSEQLVLLLDGFDEIGGSGEKADVYKKQCIQMIVDFQKEYKTCQMVICSRTQEFLALDTKFKLNMAIELGELSDTQIQNYLNHPELAGLREVIKEDETLKAFTKTALLLYMMGWAYQDKRANVIRLPLEEQNEAMRQEHLFKHYIEHSLAQQNIQAKYPPRNISKYLGWLARTIRQENLKPFYIENVEPRLLTQYPTPSLTFQVFYALAYILFGGLLGMITGILNRPYFIETLLMGMGLGAIAGIILVFSGIWKSRLIPVERFTRIDDNADILGFTIGGIVTSLVVGVTTFMRDYQIIEFLIGFGIAFAVCAIILAILIFRTEKAEEKRITPNYGIRASRKNAMIFLGICVGLILLTGLLNPNLFGVEFTMASLIILAAGSALLGGDTVIRHGLARLIFRNLHKMPLNYAHFLDEMAEARIMRKVGGGYNFLHDELAKYYAQTHSTDPI